MIFKSDPLIRNANDASAKIPLAIQRRAGLDPRLVSGKPFVILSPIKPSLQTRRRNLQRISRVDEIFHVEDGADLQTHGRTIIVSHAARLINEHAHRRMPFGAGDFRMDQLYSVVDRGLPGNLPHALCNRP